MHRTLLPLVLLSLLAVAPAARAQGVKIGYVDVQRAVAEVEEGKAARKTLQTELEQRKQLLEAKKNELQKLQTDYERQRDVLNDEAKRKKQEELQGKLMEAQSSAGQMQEELQRKEQEAMGSISRRMILVVGEVSEREGLTYVLDKAVLLYGPSSADITNEVVRKYNDKFPAAATPKSADAPKKGGKK